MSDSNVSIGVLLTYAFQYYRDIFQGIRSFSEQKGDWRCVPARLDRGVLRYSHKKPPVGLIAAIETPELVEAVNRIRMPVVNVGGTIGGLKFPWVGVDNDAAGALAAEHFIGAGLCHFGFIGHRIHKYSVEREEGFRKAINDAGFSLELYRARKTRPFPLDASECFLDRGVKDWLLKLPKPIGILAPTDYWGLELSDTCREIGISVPEQVSIVGVDNDEFYCKLSHPPLSSVEVSAEKIGYEAAELLDRILTNRNKGDDRSIAISPPHVCVRRSSEVLLVSDPAVASAMRFIRENSHQGLTAINVAQFVSTGKRTLERRFQGAIGAGIAQEIRRAQLEHGKRLLIETDFSISEVATRAGFSDVRHLATTFRREVMLTPTEYRRKFRLESAE